jgi:hypothetical protein
MGEPGCEIRFQNDHGQRVAEDVVHVTRYAFSLRVAGELPHRDRSAQRQRRHHGRRHSIARNDCDKRPWQAQHGFLDERQRGDAAHDQRHAAQVAGGHPGGKRNGHDEKYPGCRIESRERCADQSHGNGLPEARPPALPVQKNGGERADEDHDAADRECHLQRARLSPNRIDQRGATRKSKTE